MSSAFRPLVAVFFDHPIDEDTRTVGLPGPPPVHEVVNRVLVPGACCLPHVLDVLVHVLFHAREDAAGGSKGCETEKIVSRSFRCTRPNTLSSGPLGRVPDAPR